MKYLKPKLYLRSQNITNALCISGSGASSDSSWSCNTGDGVKANEQCTFGQVAEGFSGTDYACNTVGYHAGDNMDPASASCKTGQKPGLDNDYCGVGS